MRKKGGQKMKKLVGVLSTSAMLFKAVFLHQQSWQQNLVNQWMERLEWRLLTF